MRSAKNVKSSYSLRKLFFQIQVSMNWEKSWYWNFDSSSEMLPTFEASPYFFTSSQRQSSGIAPSR